MSSMVNTTTADGLARITLDHPPLNILTNDGLAALGEAFSLAADDPSVRVIRLDARGKAFSAGVDVGDHQGDKVRTMMDALARLFETLERCEQPIVAQVHGAALGGGCELIAAADLCYAAVGAQFGQPEIRLGLFAPPASVLLPRLLGERRALELLLTGEPLSAELAARIGLVNRVVPADRLEAAVDEVCNTLLSLSGAALRQAKKAVKLARGAGVVEAHRAVHRQYLDELMHMQDAHEGLAAFLEKRAANWRHC